MSRAFTTREKVLLVVLAVLLLGIGYFKLILEPINERIETAQAQMAAEQDEMLTSTVQAAEKKRMQGELDELFASGEAMPLPDYDNSGALLIELHTILDASDEYTLNFDTLSELDGGYIVRRPVNLTFRTKTYDEARTIIDALHDSANVNVITDISMQFDTRDGSESVQVTATIQFFERKR